MIHRSGEYLRSVMNETAPYLFVFNKAYYLLTVNVISIEFNLTQTILLIVSTGQLPKKYTNNIPSHSFLEISYIPIFIRR